MMTGEMVLFTSSAQSSCHRGEEKIERERERSRGREGRGRVKPF
jgi:hypothetical protein